MTCEHVNINGVNALICSRGKRRRLFCRCGQPATQACDWKVKARRSGTCDEPICQRCAYQPAAGKDLCPVHAAEWQRRTETVKEEAR